MGATASSSTLTICGSRGAVVSGPFQSPSAVASPAAAGHHNLTEAGHFKLIRNDRVNIAYGPVRASSELVLHGNDVRGVP